MIDKLDFDDIAPSNKPEDKGSPPEEQVEHAKTAPLGEPQLKDALPKMKSKHKLWYPDWAGVKQSMSKEKPRNLYALLLIYLSSWVMTPVSILILQIM